MGFLAGKETQGRGVPQDSFSSPATRENLQIRSQILFGLESEDAGGGRGLPFSGYDIESVFL